MGRYMYGYTCMYCNVFVLGDYMYMCVSTHLTLVLMVSLDTKTWPGGHQGGEHITVVLTGHHQGRDDRV